MFSAFIEPRYAAFHSLVQMTAWYGRVLGESFEREREFIMTLVRLGAAARVLTALNALARNGSAAPPPNTVTVQAYRFTGGNGREDSMWSGEEGFRNWGMLAVDRSPYCAKRAYQFAAMTTGIDGTIFIGESDRRACLFLFIPDGQGFPGGLNPSNPR
jgi:hypothetical protein